MTKRASVRDRELKTEWPYWVRISIFGGLLLAATWVMMWATSRSVQSIGILGGIPQ